MSLNRRPKRSNIPIDDLAMFYGLYSYSILTGFDVPYIENKYDPKLKSKYTNQNDKPFKDNYFFLDYNSDAQKCLTKHKCDPKYCHMGSSICLAKNCENNTETCAHKSIQYPIKRQEYDDIYVHSRYDGSKWKLHKIIPCHIPFLEYTQDISNFYYIFIFQQGKNKVVCFPYGDVIFTLGIYSPVYLINDKDEVTLESVLDENGILDYIIDDKDSHYVFCGHSMGCIMARYFYHMDWGNLEHLKKNCIVIGSGGPQTMTTQEMVGTNTHYFIYGEDKGKEVVCDKYVFRTPSKFTGASKNFQVYLIHNNEIKPEWLSRLTPCDPYNSMRMHSWNTYRNGLNIFFRDMIIKKNKSHRSYSSYNKQRRSRKNKQRRYYSSNNTRY